jgi:PIN domain nuclease of toxin-antitoxin system
MSAVVIDTHAAVWASAGGAGLSPVALTAVNDAAACGDPVFLSAISLVEVAYLVEKGRLDAGALARLYRDLDAPTGGYELAAVDRLVAEVLPSIPRAAVPDMPDRIIAATALSLGLPLVTRDQRLRACGIQTIW